MAGGEFLHNTMKERSSMTKKVKVSKQGYPYMYEMYNINCYFAGMGITSPLKIINTLIDTLNDEDHLLKYVLFIPDKDQDLLHKRLGALQP